MTTPTKMESQARWSKFPTLWNMSTFLPILLIPNLITNVSAMPVALDITDWLASTLFPKPGSTLADEIKCYNLPYGAIGTISHILTYYTTTMLLLHLTPIFPRPGQPLQWSILDSFLSAISIFGSAAISTMNIYACRFRWQFICIGIWKLTMSLTIGIISFHQAAVLWQDRRGGYTAADDGSGSGRSHYRARLWLVVYFLGSAVGLAGLFSLVIQDFSDHNGIRIMTYIFAGVAGIPFAIWILVVVPFCIVFLYQYLVYFVHLSDKHHPVGWKIYDQPVDGWTLSIGFFLSLASFGLFGAFYCDWVLAAVAGNWGGLPSSDIALLYWGYFIAKRLPMLSI